MPNKFKGLDRRLDSIEAIFRENFSNPPGYMAQPWVHRSRPGPSSPGTKGAHPATDGEPEGGVGLRLPPQALFVPRTPTPKYYSYRFVPPQDPCKKHPPAFFPPKNFQTKKLPWVPGGVGLGMIPAYPWPRGKVTLPLTTDPPLRGVAWLWRPSAPYIYLSGAGLGAHLRVPVLPAGKVGQEKGDGVTHRFWRQHLAAPHLCPCSESKTGTLRDSPSPKLM